MRRTRGEMSGAGVGKNSHALDLPEDKKKLKSQQDEAKPIESSLRDAQKKNVKLRGGGQDRKRPDR